jgi:hypothetical protein
MDLHTLANAIVLIVVAGIGSILFSRRLDRMEGRLDGRIDAMGARLDGRIDGISARLDGLPTRDEFEARFGRLESEVSALRSDMTQIALALGVRPRPQAGSA